MKLSQRVTNLKPSATLAVAQRASSLQKQGKDVVNFGVGQLQFPTPEHICTAAQQAIRDGHTGYALPTAGKEIAIDAIAQKLQRDNGLQYQSDQVIVTEGAKEALFLALSALVDPGDEVIIMSPYWVSYPDQVRLLGGTPVIVDGLQENGFRVLPEQLSRAITPNTRVVIINSPSNPCGVTYNLTDMTALAEVLSGRDITVLSDDIYDQFVFDGQHVSWASINSETFERSLTINACSKTYAMTGWRLGYAAGPVEIIKSMAKIKGQTTSGVCNFNQHGMAAALSGDQRCVKEIKEELDRRRLLLHDSLSKIKGIASVKPQGAIYCFPNVREAMAALDVADAVTFSQRLLEEIHVAVVPGEAFGSPDNVRMSFALSADRISTAMERLTQLLGTA